MKYLLLLFLLTCIFNIPLLASAETENNELVQSAKADAQRDAKKDVNSAYWVAGGYCVSSGSSLLLSTILFSQYYRVDTCLGGTITGKTIPELIEREGYICLGASLIISLGYHTKAMLFTPTPPANRLLGKPPAYVKSYTATYTHETRKLQTQSAIAGSVIWCFSGAGGALILIGITRQPLLPLTW